MLCSFRTYLGKTLLVSLVSFSIFHALPMCSARTIQVPNDYRTLQGAVAAASDGDVIIVSPGTYEGFTVEKSVTIMGSGRDAVVIRGQVVVNAGNAALSTMTVEIDEKTGGNSALVISGSGTKLVNIRVRSYRDGIWLGTVDKQSQDNAVEHSVLECAWVALNCIQSGRNTYYNNTIVSEQRQGIIAGTGDVILRNRVEAPTGISLSALRSGVQIKSNTVNGRETAIRIAGPDSTIESNTILGNSGVALEGGGNLVLGNVIEVSGTGVVTVKDNVIRNNRIGAGGHCVEISGDNNRVLNNSLSGGKGIHASGGAGNLIAFNVISYCGVAGAYMSGLTQGNLIYGNSFLFNYGGQAADFSGRNLWYVENASLRLGNYWSDHAGSDANGDGIIDVPYSIPGSGSVDKYPLARVPEASVAVVLPVLFLFRAGVEAHPRRSLRRDKAMAYSQAVLGRFNTSCGRALEGCVP